MEKKNIIATVGTFDGMHRGHEMVLDFLRQKGEERALEPLIITFDGHPLEAIDPSRAPGLLLEPGEKLHLLRLSGLNTMMLHFNSEMASLTARQWLLRLQERRGVEAIVIGYDNTFGCDGRTMTQNDYLRLGADMGMEVFVAPEIEGISSSKIRKAVRSGRMHQAAEMIGNPFSLRGEVISGNQIGRTIGVPTANLRLPDPRLLVPDNGVYAVMAITPDGMSHPAVANIGMRPTLDDPLRDNIAHIEANILDFNGDLYGKFISLEFIEKIRDERKFDSLESLKIRIEDDRLIARRILKRM